MTGVQTCALPISCTSDGTAHPAVRRLYRVSRGLRDHLPGGCFPGHFLVRCTDDGRILDPFHKGRRLTEQDCRRLLERQGLPAARWRDEFLAPARKAEILQRMLNNLHRHYASVGDTRRLNMVFAMVRVMRQAGEAGGGLIH